VLRDFANECAPPVFLYDVWGGGCYLDSYEHGTICMVHNPSPIYLFSHSIQQIFIKNFTSVSNTNIEVSSPENTFTQSLTPKIGKTHRKKENKIEKYSFRANNLAGNKSSFLII
jgi:hypothetical protein